MILKWLNNFQFKLIEKYLILTIRLTIGFGHYFSVFETTKWIVGSEKNSGPLCLTAQLIKNQENHYKVKLLLGILVISLASLPNISESNYRLCRRGNTH